MVHHSPNDRAEDHQRAEHSGDHRAGDNEYLDDDEHRADDKNGRRFQAGERGDVVAEEKERKSDQRDDAGNSEAGCLHLDVCADDPAEEK